LKAETYISAIALKQMCHLTFTEGLLVHKSLPQQHLAGQVAL